jgi:hypothetical protein
MLGSHQWCVTFTAAAWTEFEIVVHKVLKAKVTGKLDRTDIEDAFDRRALEDAFRKLTGGAFYYRRANKLQRGAASSTAFFSSKTFRVN